MKKRLILLTSLLFLGCSPEPTKQLKTISYGAYNESSFEKLPSWEDENFAQALTIFQETCKHVDTNELFKVVCSNSKKVDNPRAFFEKNFTPFVSISKETQVSGYYEPLLYGSLKKNKSFKYPVYGTPKDMFSIELLSMYQKEFSKPLRGHIVNHKIKPYFSRKQIEKGAVKTKPLCYVSDKINLYFLQEKGAGRIELPSKKNLYLGYADHNGHPYADIKEIFIDKKIFKKKELSPKKMREYLRNNPKKQEEIFNTNANYTFFEKYKQSPMSSLGMHLTPQRSAAVDRKSIPLGMPMFIDMNAPLKDKNIQKIVFAHDTQKEVKGDGKISLYYGSGKTARNQAEATNQNFKLWILVPNDYLHHDYMLKSKYL